MKGTINFNFLKRQEFILLYALILALMNLQKVNSQFNLTKYDIQENGIGVEYTAIATTVNGNLICSSWHYSSSLINYFGLKLNGRPYFTQNGKETYFCNTTTTQIKTEGVIFGINLKNSEENKEYIISFGNNNANFELYNFNIEPTEVYYKQGTAFFNTNYNSFSQVSFFNLMSDKYSYVASFIANENDAYGTKSFFIYKLEFNKIDINDDTQIIEKTNVERSYDAYISSCFETESGTFLCFFAISDTSLRIAAYKFEGEFSLYGQIVKSRELSNQDLFYKCVHVSGNMGAFLYYKKENEVIISFIKYENRVLDINKDIVINNNGYLNNIRNSDFIKLTDKKICFFSVSSVNEAIKIKLINNYEGELFKLKEYILYIYQTNGIKIYGGLKATSFNGFIAMSIIGQSVSANEIRNSYFLILNYPNSEDSEFDITDFILYFLEPKIDFREKGSIQNNISNFIYSGVIIYNFTEGLRLFNFSDNQEISKNVSLIDDIIIKFDDSINFDNDLLIEFGLTAKEPECEIYSDNVVTNEDCSKEKDYENLKTYIGKISYLKIIIDWTQISKECGENCLLCNTLTDKECYICKNDYIKSSTEKSKCISESIVEEKLTSQILNEQISSTILNNENNIESITTNEQNNDIIETEITTNYQSFNIIETEKKTELKTNKLTHNIIETEKNTEIKTNSFNIEEILNNRYINEKINIEQYEDIKESLLNKNKNNTEENIIIRTETLLIQLSSLDDQKNSDNSNISSIDIGECENILKTTYNLSEEENLIIYKVDIKTEDLSNTYVIYELYDSSFNPLNLSYCQNTTITINVPVQLDENLNTLVDSLSESGYDIFDEEDSFYNDICSTYTNQNGSDMLLSDRKTDIYTNILNQTFCQTGCELKSYNATTKKAKCNCNIEEETVTQVTADEDSFSKKEIAQSFYDTLKNSNFQVLKCYKLIFDGKRIKKNYGEILMFCLLILFIILWVIYSIKGQNNFDKIIIDIVETKNLFSELKNKDNLLIYDQPSNTTNQYKELKIPSKESKSKLNDVKNYPPKKRKKKSKKDKKKKNKKSSNQKETSKNKIDKRNKKDINEIDLKGKNIYNNIILNMTNEKFNQNSTFNSYYEYLNDEEKNTLEYEKAIILDKRTYFQYYCSLLKKKQLILFTFLPANDYNLIYVKITLFIVSFSLYFTINGFFFTDETMHDIYKDNGVFNFLYQIPQILYSSIISSLINLLLKQLSLSEKNILEIKKLEINNDVNNNEKVKKIKSYLRVKLILFFIFSFLLMLFFWYFISCFCSVYINTQTILIKDTLISFVTSMLYPFGLCLLPGFFRIPSLKKENDGNKCLYKFSLIVAII